MSIEHPKFLTFNENNVMDILNEKKYSSYIDGYIKNFCCACIPVTRLPAKFAFSRL